MSNSLRRHGLQHSRLSCPSLSSGVCSDSCLFSQWCYSITSSCVAHFSSCPQYFPGSFPMSQLFTSGGQSFNICPSNEHPGLVSFRMDWLDLLAVQGTLKSLLQNHSSKASVLCSAFFRVQLSHPYRTTEKHLLHTKYCTKLFILIHLSHLMYSIFNKSCRVGVFFFF